MAEKVYDVNIAAKDFHHGNLRAALVTEGLAALERGEDVSLRELARRVGVSPMATYRHFADKDALRAALADAAFAVFAETVAVADTVGLLPDDRLMVMGRAYVSFARARPAMFHLIFAAPIDMAQVNAAGPGAAHAFRPLVEVIAAIMQRPVDAEEVTIGLSRIWAVTHGYAALSLSGRLPKHVTQTDPFEAILQPVIASLSAK
jgi:AcrR family transcriptional regulator